MTHMNTKMQKIKNLIFIIIPLLMMLGCSISPGMHMSTNSDSIYIESIGMDVKIKDINSVADQKSYLETAYRIGNGDQIAITIWGLPEIFPIANINPDQNLRRVDSNGNIFFPYAGLINAAGKTQNELREALSKTLEKYFNEPQLDVSIARFNSQKVYMLGEVTTPSKLNITDIPLSLSDALGEVNGINTNTGDGYNVFIIRNGQNKEIPEIYKANLASPAGFLDAGNFYLMNNDIVYVNAKGTTRWNKVISQFFPFSTFLNSVDNLTNND